MKPVSSVLFAAALTAAVAATAAAQDTTPPPPAAPAPQATTDKPTPAPAASAWQTGRPQTIQYFRFLDRRGINTFETTKDKGVEYDGFKLDFGAAFVSDVQNLTHSNTADPVIVAGVNTNQLADIGFGMNNSAANFYVHAQLAPGIRVQLTSYLSSRHHNETWVKDGFLQMDESPFDWVPLKAIMQIATIRVGHMEINYGDAHFRRTDNGNGIWNPFIGNYILDAFTTEEGVEVYLKPGHVIAMGSITSGDLHPTVLTPGQRGPSFIGKLGYDSQVNKNVRVRLTGSIYKANKSLSNTLYGGDRGGSRFFYVLENTAATESAQAFSGTINPGFKNKITAMVFNPFVKVGGLEVFGTLERAKGMASTEASERVFKQYAADIIYRCPSEKLFAALRLDRAVGQLTGITGDAGANRTEASVGWFLSPNMLLKGEYVRQTYFGFPSNNIKNGGIFKGTMLEAVVGF